MDEFAGLHPSDDLHVPVAMSWEATATCDVVLVEHEQRAESHALWIVIGREGEAVVCLKPAIVHVSAIDCAQYLVGALEGLLRVFHGAIIDPERALDKV